MSWIEEAIIVISYRQRSAWMLIIGIYSSLAILMYGEFIISTYPDSSIFSDIIKTGLAHRAEKAAIGIIILTIISSIKMYLKDRKRLIYS